MLARHPTTFVVLVPLALSIVGSSADRSSAARSGLLAADPGGNDAFVSYDPKFEAVWAQDKIDRAHEILKLTTLKANLRQNIFQFRNDEGTDVAGKTIHVAIATEMFDKLTQSDAQVMDLGCGAGALMAVFIEVVSSNCDNCKVEGVEYDDHLVDGAEFAFEYLFSDNERFFDSEEKLGKMKGVSKSVTQGDATAWNSDFLENGKYDVINVGFAILAGGTWSTAFENWKKALKDGGKLIVPLCTTNPVVVENHRCAAKFHIFHGGASQETYMLDVPINFWYLQ
mmetsp:Transcript_52915/g.105132  ORF Transcript_52915/g.105132 Transcript_52915/m.105132 type:complete len:283 (-) Transcript_52915:17-865(-)